MWIEAILNNTVCNIAQCVQDDTLLWFGVSEKNNRMNGEHVLLNLILFYQ